MAKLAYIFDFTKKFQIKKMIKIQTSVNFLNENDLNFSDTLLQMPRFRLI